MRKSIVLSVVLCSVMLWLLMQPTIYPAIERQTEKLPFSISDNTIIKALNFLKSRQAESGAVGDIITTAWVAMALRAAGENLREWNGIVDYLRWCCDKLNKVTDWEREALAIVACGESPRSFCGIDFVEKIESFYDGKQIGSEELLNDDVWGIIALISCGVAKDDPIIQNVKSYIIKHQNEDGGWGISISGKSDVDSTAATIMALAACGIDKKSEIIQSALRFLRSRQLDNGGFSSWGSANSATTSWAIMALSSIGQSPEEWTKDGNSPVGYLLSLQREDGHFGWNETLDVNPEWMTSYAVVALLGKYYPVCVYNASSWIGYVRIEGKNRTIWEGSVTVTDTTINALNVSSGQWEEHYVPYPSPLGALVEASAKGGFSYVVEYYPSWDALYVKTIDNDSDWWHYWVDYELPMISCDKYVLTKNDSLVIFGYVESWEAHLLKISVDKHRVKRNEIIKVMVKDEDDNPIEDATVYVDSSAFMTDADGTVSIRITKTGTYKIYAEKEGYVRSEKVSIEVQRSSSSVELLETIIQLTKFIVQQIVEYLKYFISGGFLSIVKSNLRHLVDC